MKRRSRSVIVIALLTALFLCAETVMVSAASLSEIRKDIREKQEELNDSKSQEKSLRDQIYDLERQINSKENDIDKLESAIAEAEVDLAEAEKDVETQSDNLGARLRNMYKTGSVGFVDVLLDSNSFSEFLTNLDLVGMIYESDQEVLDGLQDAYDEIDRQKKEIEAAKTDAEEQKAALEASQAEIAEKKAEIAADVEETEKELDRLEADAEALSSTIRDQGSSSSDSTYLGGEMAWPAPSYTRISSYFGTRIHPITGKKKTHGGLDLAAPGGSPILAANSGKVIISGYDYSYGNYIVIDHGGGVSTLYAHASKRLVSKGQSVSRGQQIAKVGTTGSSTGNHLHFEVRINGTRVNPLPYIT